jgi:hypothetical protein
MPVLLLDPRAIRVLQCTGILWPQPARPTPSLGLARSAAGCSPPGGPSSSGPESAWFHASMAGVGAARASRAATPAAPTLIGCRSTTPLKVLDLLWSSGALHRSRDMRFVRVRMSQPPIRVMRPPNHTVGGLPASLRRCDDRGPPRSRSGGGPGGRAARGAPPLPSQPARGGPRRTPDPATIARAPPQRRPAACGAEPADGSAH